MVDSSGRIFKEDLRRFTAVALAILMCLSDNLMLDLSKAFVNHELNILRSTVAALIPFSASLYESYRIRNKGPDLLFLCLSINRNDETPT